jgi:uncharacterized membrane protein YkvI
VAEAVVAQLILAMAVTVVSVAAALSALVEEVLELPVYLQRLILVLVAAAAAAAAAHLLLLEMVEQVGQADLDN